MDFANYWFSSGAGGAGYEIEQSLRFDGSSYLQRTSTTTSNRQQMTISVWAKFINDPFTTGDNHNTWYGTGNISSASGHVRLSVGNGSGQHPYFLLIQNNGVHISTSQFRDPGAWYHFVTSYNAATSTHRCWVNGVEITNWNTNQQSSSSLAYPNSGDVARIGVTVDSGGNLANYMKGYLAEYHYLESAVTDPNDFGEYDDNGVWRPIAYTGSHGTNGFYLTFDPSATNGIGHDHSGNGNNFTASGFTTSGTGTDVMDDTPTTNWCTMSPLGGKRDSSYSDVWSLSNGNLVWAASASTGNPNSSVIGTVGVSSGKWYFEVTRGAGDSLGIGWATHAPVSYAAPNSFILVNTKYSTIATFGDFSKSFSNPTLAPANGDVIGIGLDIDGGTLSVWINGTVKLNAGAISGLGAGNHQLFPFVGKEGSQETGNATFNFGQRAFEQTVPSGYKALNTSNLPAPDIADGSQYMNTVAWTGTGASRTIDFGMQPDWIWAKGRNTAANHRISDNVRGGDGTTFYNLCTNNTNAENTDTVINGITSTGVTFKNVDDHPNISGSTYVGWGWKAGGAGGSSNTAGSITSTVSANPSAGFSIVSYTGTGSTATVGHGLGVAPDMVITKPRDGGSHYWGVYHRYGSQGAETQLQLQTTTAPNTGTSFWNGTHPTSTVFTVNTASGTNNSGSNIIAYCFTSVEGYSKFGSYTGNSSSDGPFIHLGFRPRFIWIKATTSVLSGYDGWRSWYMVDTERYPYNSSDENQLWANLTAAEDKRGDGSNAGNLGIDLLSNGFKIRRDSSYAVEINYTGATYIYCAWAEHPFGGSGVSPATAR